MDTMHVFCEMRPIKDRENEPLDRRGTIRFAIDKLFEELRFRDFLQVFVGQCQCQKICLRKERCDIEQELGDQIMQPDRGDTRQDPRLICDSHAGQLIVGHWAVQCGKSMKMDGGGKAPR
jgi:hypothetical protein